MNKSGSQSEQKPLDSIQQRLTDYACDLKYEDLSPQAIHAAKVRIIDTLGALLGGFFGESCQIARNLAAQMPNADGATVIGTRMKTTPDMAAFVNGTTARYVELTDSYHWPGSRGGHPSDVVTPILAVAEHAQTSGRELITGLVVAYEAMLRICDVLKYNSFDYTNFICLGTAVAAGKLLNLSPSQLSHCISMAVVPNVTLGQARLGHVSMFKAAAAGQAGRAGVFAALQARAGMEGPHLPFEGKAGWCDHVVGNRFSLNTFGGGSTPFKIADTMIKPRASAGGTISSILAAEKVGPLKNLKDVKQITVEVYKKAKEHAATGEHHWNVKSKEAADHSIPYVTAATLIDGTLTPRSYNDAHLLNPELRALMQKIEVVENEEFTRANNRHPMEHHTRVIVMTDSGERLVGKSGGAQDDVATPKSDAQIEEKFRGLAEDVLGAKQMKDVLDRLWHLDEMANAAEIPAALIFA